MHLWCLAVDPSGPGGPVVSPPLARNDREAACFLLLQIREEAPRLEFMKAQRATGSGIEAGIMCGVSVCGFIQTGVCLFFIPR